MKVRPHLAVAVALIAWSGCGQRTSSESRTGATDDSTTIQSAPDATQGDSVLVALGNEPFWNVRVTSREILYRDPEHQRGYRFPAVAAVEEGDARVYRTRRDLPPGESGPRTLELRVRQGACSDGMSDNQYWMVSQLMLGETAYTGCAKLEADTARAGR